MSYLGQIQNLDWTSPSRIFATTVELFNSQPNYENEVAIALDTATKYRGVAPVVGGWGFASGAAGPVPAPVPPPVNDNFTKLLVEFDGIEGSTTYPDTNAANWPRKYKTEGFAGFGGTTNVGEKFPLGALRLDGNTVITAPDEHRFDFTDQDFTIRGWFLCDFPLGISRTLLAKSTGKTGPDLRVAYSIDRGATGNLRFTLQTTEIVDHTILVRDGSQIVDRFGEFVISRFVLEAGVGTHALVSATIYSDTINPGWHEFKAAKQGNVVNWVLDGVTEDTEAMLPGEIVNQVVGPITIGGVGPPIDGVYQGNPWVGGLDRHAIDIGIAR